MRDMHSIMKRGGVPGRRHQIWKARFSSVMTSEHAPSFLLIYYFFKNTKTQRNKTHKYSDKDRAIKKTIHFQNLRLDQYLKQSCNSESWWMFFSVSNIKNNNNSHPSSIICRDSLKTAITDFCATKCPDFSRPLPETEMSCREI